MKSNMFSSRNCVGFSLVEMSVVLVILGFVLAALLLPIQAQRTQLFQTQTENTLEIARKALLGYAQSKGRLPCPATAVNFQSNTDTGSGGQESPLGGTHNVTPPSPAVPNCTVSVGYLPAATLGIQPTDPQGFAVDGWNNRIRYAVTANNNSAAIVNGTACGGDTAPDFTTTGNMAAVGLACLAPDLRVCSTSVGITASACSGGTETNYLINNAVVVIYSTGATETVEAATLPPILRPDETANLNNDTVFVSHDIAATAGNEFDHLVVWLSPYVLYNAMVETGQLH